MLDVRTMTKHTIKQDKAYLPEWYKKVT